MKTCGKVSMSFGEAANLPLLRTTCKATVQPNSRYPDLVFSVGAVSPAWPPERFAARLQQRARDFCFGNPCKRSSAPGAGSLEIKPS